RKMLYRSELSDPAMINAILANIGQDANSGEFQSQRDLLALAAEQGCSVRHDRGGELSGGNPSRLVVSAVNCWSRFQFFAVGHISEREAVGAKSRSKKRAAAAS